MLKAIVGGEVYITFYQGETLMFIRRIVGDSYELVWMNDQYNSF
jgi:hypothetical protein